MALHTYGTGNDKGIAFFHDENRGYMGLDSLFGIKGVIDPDHSLGCRGLFFLDTDLGRFEAEALKVEQCVFAEHEAFVRWAAGESGLFVESRFSRSPGHGVWSRRDTLINNAGRPVTVYSCVSRYPLAGEDYSIYAQSSGWQAENQGKWMNLGAGVLELSNEEGRSCNCGTPFACIRNNLTGLSAALHVLPVGDWVIRFRKIVTAWKAAVVLETGLSDRGLRMVVEPGERIELPETLLFGFEGPVENSAPILHGYLLDRYGLKKPVPVVYNTWFYDFDRIDPDKLRVQIDAAKRLGCEIFVVDAGWFGKDEGWAQVGWWHEKTHAAFRGRMKQFADEVRAADMGFGLWMEPERIESSVELVAEKPDWFVSYESRYYDITKPEVWEYLFSEICRLVEEYDLAWMKVDFNNNMGHDPRGSNFYRYYSAYYRLVDRVRERYPQVFFEACASGGLRSDILNSMKYCGHFLTDTVNPIEVLRIYQGGVLRMLPGFFTKWTVVRPMSSVARVYSHPYEGYVPRIAACADAVWDKVLDLSADFAAKVCVPGVLGFSSDLASLPEPAFEQMKKAVELYKRHRGSMVRSVCYLLTPVSHADDICGWAVMQLVSVDDSSSLLFAYRLNDDIDTFVAYPRGLEKDLVYRVTCDGSQIGVFSGAHLACSGIPVACGRYEAKVIEMTPVPKTGG